MNGFKKYSLLICFCSWLVPGAALAQDNNGGTKANATPGSLTPNQGHILCTAAINSDGTIATRLTGSYINSANTKRLSTGTYQVAFNYPCGNVQIVWGWFRLVQPDTLTDGTLPARSCIVADRAGVPSALWIQCFSNTGALTDTSFTVSVSK
jgi:hypothetical protein